MFRTFRWSEHFEEGTLRFAVTASYQNGSFCVAGWKRSHRDDNSFAPIPDIGIFQNPHRVFEGGRALIRRARTHTILTRVAHVPFRILHTQTVFLALEAGRQSPQHPGTRGSIAQQLYIGWCACVPIGIALVLWPLVSQRKKQTKKQIKLLPVSKKTRRGKAATRQGGPRRFFAERSPSTQR